MSLKIPIETSARHIHITQEDFETLFGSGAKPTFAKELSQPGQDLYGIQFTNNGKIVIFGGGEVLEYEGKIIGALGVSGGSAAEDTAIAAYGKEVFKEVLECL